MLATAQLPSALIDLRLDAVLVTAVTGVSCLLCRRYVASKPAGGELSRMVCLAALAISLFGAVTAEWITTLLQGLAGDSSSQTVAILRSVVLVGTLAGVGIVLFNATVISLLRAELGVRESAERKLHEARAAAESANRAKGDFLAVMSHEIRTPLNAVLGFANLLAESKLDEIQRGYLATITSEGARLSSLVNDILDLSKIEEGRLALERVPFAPAESAYDVLRLLSPRAEDKHLDLRFEAQLAGPLLIAGDPLRFRQILVNLVDNAIKFTSHGSVTLFLTWQAPGTGGTHGRLVVRVKDTGIGISAEKQRNLFQMFMQADASTTRRYGGTGLGLAICQRLVTMMGGEIVVVSQPGQGAEFSFELPATPVALPVEPEPAETQVLASVGRKLRVLVVDDIQTNRFLLEVFLSRNGFQPDLASDADEAIRLASRHHYDAILMDLQMPGGDGYGAVQRIRAAEPAGMRTPIIALTASIAPGTREKCLAAGMDEHLTKPLDLTKFRMILARLIAGAARRNHPGPSSEPSSVTA